MLPTLAYGDAVGNNVLALRDALLDRKINTQIYAENIDKKLPEGTALPFEKYIDDDSTVIIFHLSIGSEMSSYLKSFKARKVFIYHNVTPPHFFEHYDSNLKKLCENGIETVKKLKNIPDFCIAVSSYNKSDLIRLGYTCPIDVLPIVINFDDYEKEANERIIQKFSDGKYTNIVFTGRIAPNKKQEDLIKSFYYYHTYVNPFSRLFIVGSGDDSAYGKKLKKYIEMLELDSIYLTGHVSFSDILAYYKVADIFLCMSEHEGFCVPLVEAMYFGVPIIAYDSSAIKETLGGCGLLLDTKDPKVVSEAINLVQSDKDLNEKMILLEENRLKTFNNDEIKERFIQILNDRLNLNL